MGGGYYDQDVAQQARSSRGEVFTFRGYETPASSGGQLRRVHPELDPRGHSRECCNQTPIVVALDVTRSRGDDTKLVYKKLPMFIGQIELKGYVEGAGISFAAIGDANSDQAPLQVGQFEADNRLDAVLAKFWIEEGGGGTGQESYELAAYYYAHRSDLVQLREGTGKKGYFFFVGDEGFYPTVEREHIENALGIEISGNVDSHEAFRALQQKYHVFFIYPQKSWQQRKADIDAEIKSRVVAAGGQYDGVDIRASLIWNNRNDLDLHVVPPSGEEIYYGNKKSMCAGWLDVDMNVRGETTKPVENVRWKKGEAPKGNYTVFVQNYAFKEREHTPTDFRVEVEIAGKVRHFDGTVSQKLETGRDSNTRVYEFFYDPEAQAAATEPEAAEPDAYAQYDDEVIKQQWASVIPAEHILLIEDPRAIVDVMLGALAIKTGATDLDGYIADMESRAQGKQRREVVEHALSGLSATRVGGEVEGSVPSSNRAGKGRSKRL